MKNPSSGSSRIPRASGPRDLRALVLNAAPTPAGPGTTPRTGLVEQVQEELRLAVAAVQERTVVGLVSRADEIDVVVLQGVREYDAVHDSLVGETGRAVLGENVRPAKQGLHIETVRTVLHIFGDVGSGRHPDLVHEILLVEIVHAWLTVHLDQGYEVIEVHLLRPRWHEEEEPRRQVLTERVDLCIRRESLRGELFDLEVEQITGLGEGDRTLKPPVLLVADGHHLCLSHRWPPFWALARRFLGEL